MTMRKDDLDPSRGVGAGLLAGIAIWAVLALVAALCFFY